MAFEILWNEDSETHIARHGITPDEVEDAIYSRPRWVAPGRSDTRLVFAQTSAGRSVLVVLADAVDGRDYVVTAPRHDRYRAARVHRERTLKMSTDTTPMDELREHYDQTDQAAALADATQETATGPVLVSTSIRLPKTLMDAVRARAAAAGVPATTLMRDWITARIDAEGSSEQVVSVADIQQLIATRAHSAAS